MSDLSPKDQALLDEARRAWGPDDTGVAERKRALMQELAAAPQLGSDWDAPAPNATPAADRGLRAAPRSWWTIGTASLLAGACFLGYALLRPAPRPPPRTTAPPAFVTPTAPAEPAAPATVAASPASASDAVPLESLPNSPLPTPKAVPTPKTEAPLGSAAATDTLTEELVLLRLAQSALRAHRADEALAALGDHAARYPHGAMRDERMTLQVLALCERGDVEAARAKLDELTVAAPGSSHLQRLAGSCAARH